jgi:hypothetical protein
MLIRNEKQSAEVIADEAISVTVDASDLTAASAEPIRNIVRRFGRPVSARAFGDFQQPALAELAIQLYQMGFTLVHCPSWPNGDGFPKSIVSDVLAQDLRDQLEQLDDVETYLLIATSRDYIAVANALKRHEVRVVVVAEDAKVCRELKACSDEFVALPATRPEPNRHNRQERVSEQAASERAAESTRSERSSSSSRSRRASEASRVERASEPAKPEPETIRLPSDAEVLSEVKRIVAAEGICTPRRLARALCPVDRTSTGEVRSRIANRIQALIDSGKLQRERLVVGGTSVETILVREDRNGRDVNAGLQGAATPSTPAPQPPEVTPELDVAEKGEPAKVDEPEQSEPTPEVPAEAAAEGSDEAAVVTPGQDLDAFVESVLRASEPSSTSVEVDGGANQPAALEASSAEVLSTEAPSPEAPLAEASPSETPPAEASSAEEPPAEAPPAETPKRSRSRRRTTKAASSTENNGTK